MYLYISTTLPVLFVYEIASFFESVKLSSKEIAFPFNVVTLKGYVVFFLGIYLDISSPPNM